MNRQPEHDVIFTRRIVRTATGLEFQEGHREPWGNVVALFGETNAHAFAATGAFRSVAPREPLRARWHLELSPEQFAADVAACHDLLQLDYARGLARREGRGERLAVLDERRRHLLAEWSAAERGEG